MKEFNIILQCGCLYKNVKILTENGYATNTIDVYWNLMDKGFIYVTKNIREKPQKLKKEDIYYFCLSSNYTKKM